jgi:hypothetical protein
MHTKEHGDDFAIELAHAATNSVARTSRPTFNNRAGRAGTVSHPEREPAMTTQKAVRLQPREGFVLTPSIERVCRRAMTYLDAGYACHFRGSAGTGKTTLAMHVANQRGRPVILVAHPRLGDGCLRPRNGWRQAGPQGAPGKRSRSRDEASGGWSGRPWCSGRRSLPFVGLTRALRRGGRGQRRRASRADVVSVPGPRHSFVH